MVDKAADNEVVEVSPLYEVERALHIASKRPYNNAAHIYAAAGKESPLSFGGSCLHKLNTLRDNLPQELSDNVTFITSQIRETTHYAMLVDIEGTKYYLDPFLWQTTPMAIGLENSPSAKTLGNIWTMDRMPNEDDALFVITFNQQFPEITTLITHKFTNEMDNLPTPAALPIKADQPSFQMQIVDDEKQVLYKLWISKKTGNVYTIWTQNGATGAKVKITDNLAHRKEREVAMTRITELLHASESEIAEYFLEARRLELELQELLKNSQDDVPASHINS